MRPRNITLILTLATLALGGCPGQDSDHDGVPDAIDNCPQVANSDQLDTNGNGIGDACESVIVGGGDTGGAAGGADSAGHSSINLNGKWNDNGRLVCLAQSGTSVTGTYLEPYICDHRDGTGQTSQTDFDFSGVLADRALTGEITVCSFGKGNPLGVGLQRAQLMLLVSADGNTLSGTFFNQVDQQNDPVTITRVAAACN